MTTTQHTTSILHNERGNILFSAFIIMVILSMSVMAISNLTLNQLNRSEAEIENINDDLFAKAMLQQSVFEFEQYLEDNDYDFTGYSNNKLTGGETIYGVEVDDISGTVDSYGEDCSEADGTDELCYRFVYEYNGGNNRLIMYSYMSKWGTGANTVEPFDFNIATDGQLILNGGFIDEAQMHADELIFTNVSPYINHVSGNHAKTSGTFGIYPDFFSDGTSVSTYFRQHFFYCEPDCYNLGLSSDPFELDTTEYLDIETESHTLETGVLSEYKVNADFFSDYDLETDIVDYVTNDGPTEAQTASGITDIATMGATLLNGTNSGDQEYTCFGPGGTPPCFDWASSRPYTRLHTASDFFPDIQVTSLGYAGVYDGDLEINYDFTIDNMEDPNTETLVVVGDLTFNNAADIDVEGFIVVLGDLYFTGDSVSISGGFYVTGETFIEFDGDEGFTNPSGSPRFTLLTMDNIFVNSHYVSRVLGSAVVEFSWFVYTEESFYVDAVNSRLFVSGAIYAAAKGNSGNEIPMEDDSGTPVRGIVINSYNGYINSSGIEVVVTSYSSFDFDPLDSSNFTTYFRQLPSFEELLLSQGIYTTKRSTIIYD